MDIVVVGRNTEIKEQFRTLAEEKLSRHGSMAPMIDRIDVQVTHERNPRLADRAERVELTATGRGPVVRAEAAAADRQTALDLASARLAERLRRARDRAKDRRTNVAPLRVAAVELANAAPEEAPAKKPDAPDVVPPKTPGETTESQVGDSPVIVRQKLHEASPMTVDQALYEMELVGHPFYLFIDVETKQPCVVYHRHGWTYGVIRLDARMADAS